MAEQFEALQLELGGAVPLFLEGAGLFPRLGWRELWREQIHWQEQHVQADGSETELEMSPFRGTLLC